MDKTPEFKFEDIKPTNRALAGSDTVRVTKSGLVFSVLAQLRLKLKDNDTISVQVSSDGRAIKLALGGPFRVSVLARKAAPQYYPRVTVNSVAIPVKAPFGSYLHRGDSLYVREEPHA